MMINNNKQMKLLFLSLSPSQDEGTKQFFRRRRYVSTQHLLVDSCGGVCVCETFVHNPALVSLLSRLQKGCPLPVHQAIQCFTQQCGDKPLRGRHCQTLEQGYEWLVSGNDPITHYYITTTLSGSNSIRQNEMSGLNCGLWLPLFFFTTRLVVRGRRAQNDRLGSC